MKTLFFNNQWEIMVFRWRRDLCDEGFGLRLKWGEVSRDAEATCGQIAEAGDAFRKHFDECPRCNKFLADVLRESKGGMK